MDTAKLKEFTTILETQRAELVRELQQLGRSAPGVAAEFQAIVPEYGDKEEDNAAEVAEFTGNLSLEHTLKRSLRDVDKALQRMGTGTYGMCVYCSKEIDERRLRARPESTSCVECKEKRLRRSVV